MTADYIIPENEVTLERLKNIFAPYYPARIIDRDEVVVVNLGDGHAVAIEIDEGDKFIQYHIFFGNIDFTIQAEGTVPDFTHRGEAAKLANRLNSLRTWPRFVVTPEGTLHASCRLLYQSGVLERHLFILFDKIVRDATELHRLLCDCG